VLLIAQTTLSVVLLVGAGLFVRSLYNIRTLRLGYDVDAVIYVGQQLRTTRLTADQQRALTDRVIAAARSMPEVVAVTPAVTIPFWSNEAPPLFVGGVENVGRLGRFLRQTGSPEYFAATGTRILRGRAFSDADRADAAPVAVVTNSMARTLWPGRDVIGQCFHISQPTSPCTTVIGVSEDVRSRIVTDDREFMYFIPATQYRSWPPSELFVRVRGDARDVVDAVRRRLQLEMPGEAFLVVRPIRELVEPTQRSWRFGAMMLSGLAVLALVLAAIGLYSAIAYALAQRTKEMAVRIALGASAHDLIALVVGQGVGLVFIGVVIGTLVSLWASRWLEALLFGVSPHDPAVFLIVSSVLFVVALAASALPGVKAARVDPTFALRID
jgi:predicted permease